MKELIISNLDNPGRLEQLYQEDKTRFRQVFNGLFPQIKEHLTAQVWYERLNFENVALFKVTRREATFVIVASLLAGVIAKLPDFTSLDPDFFYPRNIGFIVFPLLTIYVGWKKNLAMGQLILLSGVMLLSLAFINLLPDNAASDTLMLSSIHLPFLLWALLGVAFTGGNWRSNGRRLEYLRFNGDLLVTTAIVSISGMLFSVVTIGLFSLLDLPAEEYFFQYVGIWGMAAIPVISAFLVLSIPQLVNKVSPVIARIFTPIVLITLTIYLAAVIITGKDPYNDREFLLLFNTLLIGVMAIILFSIAGTAKHSTNKTTVILLLALSIVTILVNSVALSAIVFRVAQWGITPNRIAVLGSNILILVHLILVAARLFKTLKNNSGPEAAETSIVSILPVYVYWILLVIFGFPFIFSFH